MTPVNRIRPRGFLLAGICLWIAASQAWYYLQFRTLFKPVLVSLLREIWR